jgi:lysophospholipase L1-like esterase
MTPEMDLWNIFSLLDDPHNMLDATLRAFPADVIILQIGGNDIDHKEFDISLYKATVRHLIFRLQELYHVNKVVICENYISLQPSKKTVSQN